MTKLQQARKVLAERYNHKWYPKARPGGDHSRGTAQMVKGRLVMRVYPPHGSPRHLEMYRWELSRMAAEMKLKGKVKDVNGSKNGYSCWWVEFTEAKS